MSAGEIPYRRIIFVDIDGVLNNSVDIECYRSPKPISKQNVEVFNRMIENMNKQKGHLDFSNGHVEYVKFKERVDAGQPYRKLPSVECVLSSTWRLHYFGMPDPVKKFQEDFRKRGIRCDWVGYTPRFLYVVGQSMERGVEINSWLQKNCMNQFVSFCILDDDRDMLGLREHLVHVTGKTGLLDIDTGEATRIMSKVQYIMR